MLETLIQDIRFARRQFFQRPGFTLTAVLILAMGLGATTAIFSVVNALLLRPLPYPHSERLVSLFERRVVKDEPMVSVAPGNFLDWQKAATSFESMSAITTGAANLASATNSFEPERIDACNCSGNLFSTLGVQPYLGRSFRPDEDRPGAPHLAVISYDLWQRRFGGARDVLGKRIRLDADDFEIIGVAPRGFMFPSKDIQVWTALLPYLSPSLQDRHDLHFFRVIGRLRAGVSVEQAAAELDGIAARYKNAHPEQATGRGAGAIGLHDSLVHDAKSALWILLGAVGCVLMIACVNLANLILTRSAARAREFCVRAAMGASRSRLIRQLLTESILLSLAGGAIGLLLTTWITETLVAHAPGADAILPSGTVPVDSGVYLFAFGIALITGIAAGLYPAIQSARADLVNGLKESSRSTTLARAHSRFRNILVTAEVALSLMLLIAAGLLLRSVSRLYQVNPGLRVGNTLTMTFSLPSATYKNGAQISAFYTQMEQGLQTLPGVRSAGLTSCPPLAGGCNWLFFYREDRPVTSGNMMVAMETDIDPEYLSAAGIPLIRGRDFTRQDGTGFDQKHPRVGSILISQATAKASFPGEDPIGKRIFFDYALEQQKAQGTPVPHYEVIGIVGDVPPFIDQKVEPAFYLPLLNGNYSGASILLHTTGDPRLLISAAQREVHKLDSSLAIYDVRTMDEIIGHSANDHEFSMLLYGAFACLAVLLAAVGLYGVLAYAVTQRTGEIGVRVALGASHSDVTSLVLKEGLKPALAGVLIGFAGALLATRILKSLLFGIEPIDPLTFAVVPPLLVAVAALACYLPAWRAARIDPTVALRTE
ncbi:MAG TPA: ABC transporter permease [Bryobacteraceae bacterium]|nr:ABC transporter permease [Bryobacteraceae bacterium]